MGQRSRPSGRGRSRFRGHVAELLGGPWCGFQFDVADDGDEFWDVDGVTYVRSYRRKKDGVVVYVAVQEQDIGEERGNTNEEGQEGRSSGT